MSLLQIEYNTLEMSGVPSAVFLFLTYLETNVFCNIMLFFCMESTELTEVASRVWITLKENSWTFGTCDGKGNYLELGINCILKHFMEKEIEGNVNRRL